MKLLKSYDLLNDEKLIKKLNIRSIILTIFFFILFTIMTVFVKGSTFEIESPVIELLISVVLLVVLIVLHELIHGLFFKVFNLKGKVKFGYKNGMFYATSPLSKYSKRQFSVIALAPFVIISAVLCVFYVLNIMPRTMFVFIAALHAGACVGDFYWMVLIAKSPKGCMIEDTEKGINFYQ